MTWRREDSGHKPTPDPSSKRGRIAATPPAAVPEHIVDEEGNPTCSVFEAMGVGNGQGLFEEDAAFPAAMERDLAREHNWPSTRQWAMIRRMMTRDTEAI